MVFASVKTMPYVIIEKTGVALDKGFSDGFTISNTIAAIAKIGYDAGPAAGDRNFAIQCN